MIDLPAEWIMVCADCGRASCLSLVFRCDTTDQRAVMKPVPYLLDQRKEQVHHINKATRVSRERVIDGLQADKFTNFIEEQRKERQS